ncbi:MAG: hypothetical protein Q8O20_00280 [Sulfuricurvum sp.]|uniref:hypothetical protein n=1 Tax=Sulfuricurvum sp. TaxID=2025608 RepID=UPI002732F454|nr:hypothetical protein [Sulfuricurvum sp.]MDP2849487.1 hypothetical protein [Sulfuricurvum sp.]
MPALKKPAFVWKVTFQKLLNEQFNDEKKAEQELIVTLGRYSTSLFENESWVLDKRSNKSHPDTISFRDLGKLGNRGKYLAKLFVVAGLNRGSGRDLQTHLINYYQFLSEKKLNLHQVQKDTLAHYTVWLDAKVDERSAKLISEVYKHKLFYIAMKFHSVMNGHSFMAYIEGIEAIENPYDRKSKDSKYKVIDQDVLEKLDAHFNTDVAPLHIRVAYWIMRLYATRPEDTLNYPLDCVKRLTDEMATIKHAVVKNSANKGEIEYKMGFLNLQEPMQKILFELIGTQQGIAYELQVASDKKDFLLTYRHVVDKSICTLSSLSYSRYIRSVQMDLKISEARRAVPRDFKKTGITLRMESGWTSPQLKQFANHRSYGSLDAYSAPSDSFMIFEQKRLLEAKGDIKSRYYWKGSIVNGIGDKYEENLLANPRAHKIADLGYCPDVASCGNHLECLDCDDLIPDADLEGYYLEQVDRYLTIAEKQVEIGEETNARDSHHRAALFASLYNKVQIRKEK